MLQLGSQLYNSLFFWLRWRRKQPLQSGVAPARDFLVAELAVSRLDIHSGVISTPMSSKIKRTNRHEDLPNPKHTLAMDEITSQTPRGAAIAGSALLDLLLRRAIEKRIRPDPEIQNILFQNRGPFQYFAARIQVAYALKIFESSAYADLNIIRDIRNVFAHSVESFDFDREDIAALCNKLWYPLKIRYGTRPMPEKPLAIFIRAIELLADGLSEDIDITKATNYEAPLFLRLGPPAPLPSSPNKQRKR